MAILTNKVDFHRKYRDSVNSFLPFHKITKFVRKVIILIRLQLYDFFEKEKSSYTKQKVIFFPFSVWESWREKD